MILGFRHRGLEQFYATGSLAGIRPAHAARLRLVLAHLAAATSPSDMNLPGLRLHPLTGNRRGMWSVRVSANWRVTFAFRGRNADQVDYEDYH